MGLKLNGTHQLLVYADVNLLGDKTRFMLLSRHQNARQDHDVNIANRRF
jgi:hypothetical protein